VIKSQTKTKTKSLEWETSRSPRHGQWLDTTEIKCSKIADSSRWGKRVRHHRQKSTTKIQAKRAPKCMNASSASTNAFLPKVFSFLDPQLPLETWIGYFPPPCW
jgi:hypothetical protein